MYYKIMSTVTGNALKSKRNIYKIALDINNIDIELHLKLIKINTEMHLKSKQNKHRNTLKSKSKHRNKQSHQIIHS